MKYLGIDYGKSKIGLAIGDDQTKLASPFKVIQEKDEHQALSQIVSICDQEGIEALVVGIPKTMQGQPAEQMKDIEHFIADLKELTKLPIVTENEALSSAAAQELLKGNAKTKIEDDVAAMVILQGYFDRK